jgi:hypothetical protein
MDELLCSITLKLENIKDQLSTTDDNCFQYYFVKKNELLLLKQEINKIPKEKFNDLHFDQDITSDKVEKEFNDLIDCNFNFIDGLNANGESTKLQIRNIIINKDEHNASYILHQDFNNQCEKHMFNILYYVNIVNCDLLHCGTGIVFIDKHGKRQYDILPVYPGLIIVLRDKCMFHHTPKLEPQDKGKPIIRTLIRKYVGYNRYENDKNLLLQSINQNFLDKTIINKKIDDLTRKIKIECFGDLKNKQCERYDSDLKKLNQEYEKLNVKAQEEIEHLANLNKYIKYKTKYIKLNHKI